MYILKYTKIDFQKCRQFAWLLLFPVLAIGLMIFSDDSEPIFAVVYCQFAGIMASGLPFSCENMEENGFLLMLPSRPGDDIRAHFLFSFCAGEAATILGLGTLAVTSLIKPTFQPGEFLVYPFLLGLCLIVIALQDILLCFFRSNNTQAMQIIRMVPAFLFFFGGSALADIFPSLAARFMAWLTMARSLGIYAVCVILFCLLAELCVLLAKKRSNA